MIGGDRTSIRAVERRLHVASAWLAGLVSLGMVSVACTGEETGPPTGSVSSPIVFCSGPTIDSWYGADLQIGAMGHAQRVVNVLGRVGPEGGELTLERSLNGGPYEAVPLGPDRVRLHHAGDFNVVIDRSQLRNGANTLSLRASREPGGTCTADLTLSYDANSRWPMPFRATFSAIPSTEDITQAAEVVDGPWEATEQGLHTVERGYYRTLAVGEETWRPGYAVRATATVHYLGAWSGVGLGMGWSGHTGEGNPPTDWPVAALGWVRVKDVGQDLEIKTFDDGTPAQQEVSFVEGETYVFEMRGDVVDAETMTVSTRVWPATGSPGEWLTADVVPRGGSVLLLAHGAEVTWHDVDVQPLGSGGVFLDAGTPGPDAGADDDPGGSDGGGGGCATTATTGGSSAWALLAVVVLLGARRRWTAPSRRRRG